jgi:acyl-CoA hydrolase
VRREAFDAVAAAVDAGVLESVEQVFFKAPMYFPDFAAFESRIIGVTHTRHRLDAATHAEVRRRFEAHAGVDGVRFEQPMRVNLLRRSAA